MTLYKKHYFNPWRDGSLGGLGQILIQPGESHSECSRCNVKVKVGKTGGTKFWVGGRWTTKRPPCEVEES